LADAFGHLKTTEAIPFLIKNIALRQKGVIDLRPWLKVPKFDARLLKEPMALEARLCAIFVVSRVKDVPEARAFLNVSNSARQSGTLSSGGRLKLLPKNQEPVTCDSLFATKQHGRVEHSHVSLLRGNVMPTPAALCDLGAFA